MIKHVWSVLCLIAITDKESNYTSLVNILERFNVPPGTVFPVNAGDFFLVSNWCRADLDTPATGRARVTAVGPSGEGQPSPEFEIDLSAFTRFTQTIRLQAFQVKEPGEHTFLVEVVDDGTGVSKGAVASVPLEVKQIDPSAS